MAAVPAHLFKEAGPYIVMLCLESPEIKELQSGDLTSDHYKDGVFVRNPRPTDLHITLCNRFTMDRMPKALQRWIGARAKELKNLKCPDGKFQVFKQTFSKAKGAPLDTQYDCVVYQLFREDDSKHPFQELRDKLHAHCGTQPDYPQMRVHTASEYFVAGMGDSVAAARNEALAGRITMKATHVLVKKYRGEEVARYDI